MQAVNMIFLAYSVVVIRSGFKWKHENAKDAEAKYKLAKRELHTIVKLGVIMGNYFLNIPTLFRIHHCSGVFWIGEFISTAIKIEYCVGSCSRLICYAQIILDIPNLLAVRFLTHRFVRNTQKPISGFPHFPGNCVQEASLSGTEEEDECIDQSQL